MKILYFTDPHNSDTPPLMRTSTYCEDILEKQEQLIEPAKKCDLVICGGDVLHQKKTEKISYYLFNRLAEIYREFPRLLIVPGNHDFDKRIEELKYNPLGALCKLPKVRVMHDWIGHFEGVNLWCFGGGEFFSLGSLEEFVEKNVAPHAGVDIGVFHAAVAEKKKNYKFLTLPPEMLDSYFELLLLGHLHDYQANHGKIVAPGALSRGVLKIDQALERKVCYAIVEVVGAEVKAMLYELDVKPVDEIFKMEEKKDTVRQQEAIDDFVGFIEKLTIPKGMSKEELRIFIEKQDVPERVKQEAVIILGELND